MLDEIVSEFLVESYESLDQLDRDLMALEESPDDRDRMSSIFRTIHTIKGTSGFLAFPHLEKVAHVGESLLVPLRDGELSLNNEITDGLLGMVDAIRGILAQVETDGTEGDEEFAALIARLEELRCPSVTQPAAPAAAEPIVEQPEAKPKAAKKTPARKKSSAKSAATTTKTTRRSTKKAAPAASVADESPDEIPETEVSESIDSADAQENKIPEPPVVSKSRAVAAPVVAVKKTNEASLAAADAGNEQQSSLADSSVRLDVSLLDKLMNLVGELVLSRNQILQFAQNSEDAAMIATSQRLNLITTELQAGVMKTRMQPIRNAWSKLPRVVRDLSISCGKQVQVVMEGAETELDKTILEAIKDPLTHIVRNSVDHGIEPADVRKANGKPAQGTLWLRAYHEGGQVNIEIADDGGGIGLDRVREKAIEKGLVTAEQAAAMSDHESTQLILLPGFSTAAKVTNVSGRGVGMDVVKTNVEKIGGTLEIQTRPGQGTTLRIKIPLTLAIIPALIVSTDGERYAIPQVSLLELVRLEGEQVTTGIEYVHGAPVYRLRGKLLPLVYLSHALGTHCSADSREQCEYRDDSNNGWDVDFVMARSKHLAWKGRLRAYLDGRETMSLDEAVSPRACSLGKWLYDEGMRDFGHLPQVVQLERLHADMHAAVGKVIQHNEQGDKAGAEKHLLDVESLSHHTVAILDELKQTAEGNGAINIVVLRANDREYGLVVDRVNDSAEIVVKPLSRQLKGLSEYAGTTIMGDGRVALILDVMGLAVASGLTADLRNSDHTGIAKDITATTTETQTLLVVDLGDTRQFALPTSMVARLEKVSSTAVEMTDNREVIQYRGKILPIVRLANVFGAYGSQIEEPHELQIIVYSEQNHSCGFAVNQILDIVETKLNLTEDDGQHSDKLLGTTVIHDRVTDVLNLCSLARY
ncbi:MAG: chemotaxis protein CheW [Fuerstiella sp.]